MVQDSPTVRASPQLTCCINKLPQVPDLLEQCGVRIFSAHSMSAGTSLTLETMWGMENLGIPCKCTRRSASCSALPSPA